MEQKRLRVFVFKTLPNPKKSAAAWLKNHAMDCVVWATEKTKDCQGDSVGDKIDEGDTGSEDEEEISILQAGQFSRRGDHF